MSNPTATLRSVSVSERKTDRNHKWDVAVDGNVEALDGVQVPHFTLLLLH